RADHVEAEAVRSEPAEPDQHHVDGERQLLEEARVRLQHGRPPAWRSRRNAAIRSRKRGRSNASACARSALGSKAIAPLSRRRRASTSASTVCASKKSPVGGSLPAGGTSRPSAPPPAHAPPPPPAPPPRPAR